jgi:hypothetical protein
VKTKFINNHSGDCYSVKNVKSGLWGTPWSYIDGAVYADKIGRLRKSGGQRWIKVRCNCTYCPAEILVCETDILESLPNNFGRGSK